MTLILLIFLFVAGVLGVGIIIVRKVPMVLATPREVVNDYFDQSSSRISVRMLRVGKWIRHGSYLDPMLAFLIRALQVIRVALLKVDRVLFHWSKGVGKKYEERKEQEREEKSSINWQDLKVPEKPLVSETEEDGKNKLSN